MKLKRSLCALLALILLLSLLPLGVSADDNTGKYPSTAVPVELDTEYTATLQVQPHNDYFYCDFTLDSYGVVIVSWKVPEGPTGEPLILNASIGEVRNGYHYSQQLRAIAAQEGVYYSYYPTKPGECCVEFELYYHFYYGMTGTYDFEFAISFVPSDNFEVEPNNSISDATYMPLAVPMFGFTGDVCDNDVWFCYTPIAFTGRLYTENLEGVCYSPNYSGVWYRHESESNETELLISAQKTDENGNNYYDISLQAGYTIICVENSERLNSGVRQYCLMIQPPVALNITKQPESVTVYEGQTAAVSVKATGKNLTYQWFYCNKGQDEFVASSVTTSTYSVTMNEERDGRYLACLITDAYGVQAVTDFVSIHMSEPFAITQQPESVSVGIGQEAVCRLEATGIDLKYQWYVLEPGSSTPVKSSITSNIYSAPMTAAKDGRRVYCIVTDGQGNTLRSNTATLSLQHITITQQPSDMAGKAGEKVSTTVVAEGDSLTYQWYVALPGATNFHKSSVTTPTYSTTMDADRDGRRVYCVITDAAGNTLQTNTVTLTLLEDVVPEHDWVDATCTAPKTCSICGLTEGEPLGHNYENGACTVCGAADPNAKPEIHGVSRMRNLSLDGVIHVYGYVGFTNADQTENVLDKDYVLENGKVLYWSAADMPERAEDALLGTQTHISSLSDAGSYGGIDEYLSISHGIAAKEYSDTIYYRTYIEVDGQAHYGDMIEYSVVNYCENQLKKTTAEVNKLKPLLAAMLHYGAAAQTYFGYHTEDPANACLQSYVDQGLLDAAHLNMNWSDSLLTDAAAANNDMCVNFLQNNARRTVRNLVLEGAIEAKMTFAYNIVDGIGTQLPEGATAAFYYWTGSDYDALAAAGTPLTKQNASYVITGDIFEEYSVDYGYEYSAFSQGIAAKQLGETLYVAAIFTVDGTEYCSGVEAYSPEVYAKAQLSKSTTPGTLANLLKWMVLYGEAAKNYYN